MASNVLIQNQSTNNSNQRIMDSINGNINAVLDNEKSIEKSKCESSDDNITNLMEKLHSKASQMKSWTELSKIMKQSLNEKRHLIDINERNQLQKCLDTIQKSIRVTSLQSMVERLETICRQLGLKFSLTTSPKGVECFVHSEMYYVEVLLELTSGHVLDCKVAHQADALSCPELTEVLQKGDFVEFTKHLEGLSAIYQINADKKNKTKAYLALHALEIDLSSLAELQNHQINDINNLVHKSPVGILEARKGGHPMKLTYFVPPYDLMDLSTKSSLPLTVDVILEKKLGYSATICIESSSSHRLQHESLINTLKTPEGKNLPQFSALTNLNSTQLPACFVLKLQKPLVTSIDILRKITAVTNIEFSYELINKREPLITLIAKQLFSSQSPNTPFYVKLPNQQHCYHLNEICDKLDGVVITSIPITHPTHVPRILVHLRQQVLFNVIIGSFIRQNTKREDITNIFEVTTTSMSNINIQFEHPTEESLATVDLDLRDVTNVKCKLYPTSSLSSFCTDDYVSKVMQRCLSIPVTMRSIIYKCKERAAALKEQMAKEQQMQSNQNELYFSSLNSANGSMDSNLGGRQPSLSYLSQQLQQYNGNGSATQLHQQLNQQFMQSNNQIQGQQQNIQRFLQNNIQKMQHHSQQHLNQEGVQNNRPQLTLQQFQQQQQMLQQHNQMLQQPQQQGQQSKHNAMLMSMLSDIPAANSQMALNLLKQQQLQQFQMQQQMQYMQQQQQPKPKKQRKRKATNDTNITRSPASSTGKSPKRKLSDDDFSHDLPDECMGTDGNGLQWGSETPNVCRPSSTPSSTASFTDTIGNIKPELNMSGGTTPTRVGDTPPAYSFITQRLPFQSGQTAQNDFNDFVPNDLPLYGETGGDGVMSDIKSSLTVGLSQALMSAKAATKRTTKRMKSDGSDDTSGTGDEGHNEQQRIIKSLEDLHQKDDFSKFLLNKDSVGMCGTENNMKKSSLINIKLSKTMNKGSGDGRRCSSAGIESGQEIKKTAIMGNNEDMGDFTAAVKKERKRKRAESVDSLKASAICATSTTGRALNSSNLSLESSMMPPPMIGSIGDVTSSSLSFIEMGNNAIKPMVSNVNIKMMPTSTSPNALQNVMKISSSGKKSLITTSVSSTSGNDPKVSKNSANKLEKNSTLSSMLKNQRQGFNILPKMPDSENSLTPSQTPKVLSFKASKSKTSNSRNALNSSPGRTKDHSNKSQLIGGLKQKSGNISSSSSKSGLSSMAVSSSSSLSPSLTSGPTSSLAVSSVTSSKQQQQQLQQQQQQQQQNIQQQQTAKLAKISRKSSLTAVVDRLRQNADATGFIPGQNSGPNESGRPESSSLSTSRPDTTSVPKVTQSGNNKIAESKTKYRSSDQFTIKQSNSGGPLKMSITKTKLSGIESSAKIGPGGTGLFKNTTTSKFTIPKLPKNNSSASTRPVSSTPSTATSSVSPNPPIKRQMSTNKVTAGTMKSPASVSSSTHPTGASVSPKSSASSGAVSVSHHNKTGSFADRSNFKAANSNPTPNKNAALNKILVDKYKPTLEPSSTTKISESPSTNMTTNKTVVESVRPAVYSKFDGATLPMPVVYSRSLSASSGNISPQLPASTTSTLQSNKPNYSKSLSVNESENMERILSNWAQQQECSAIDTAISDQFERNINNSISFSNNNNYVNTSTGNNNNLIRSSEYSAVNSIEKAGVSSSSDVKASTSTPSSPAEMALISDAFQNPPPLIPTEAIDDESEGGSVNIDVNGECENSSSIAIDSSESTQECRPTASTTLNSIEMCSTVSANDTFNEVSTSDYTRVEPMESVDSVTAVTQSRRESLDVSESKVDEDEDNDGLVIDEPILRQKPIRSTSGSNSEAVSSSTSRSSGLNNGSQSPNKCSTSPISSSITPPLINTTPALPLSGITGSSVTSPSNHSTTSSIQRPSPYHIADIDDQLMDEALVGSNE